MTQPEVFAIFKNIDIARV